MMGNPTIVSFQSPVRAFWSNLPADYHVYALATLALISVGLLTFARYVARSRPTITRKRKKLLKDQQEFVTTVVKSKKVTTSYRKGDHSGHELIWD